MFQVGDIITGIRGNPYSWTNQDAVMEVTRTNGSSMVVKVLECIAFDSMTSHHVGDTTKVNNNAEYFEYYGIQSKVSIRLDKNFNIISEGLTDDEQKDFYIALQEWKPECEGTSTEPRVQEVEARRESIHPTPRTRHPELGVGDLSGIIDYTAEWAEFVRSTEQPERSEHSREQARDIPHPLPILTDYQLTSMDSRQIFSRGMDRAGTQGRSTHITQRAQRERDRNDSLDRFLRGRTRPAIR